MAQKHPRPRCYENAIHEGSLRGLLNVPVALTRRVLGFGGLDFGGEGLEDRYVGFYTKVQSQAPNAKPCGLNQQKHCNPYNLTP